MTKNVCTVAIVALVILVFGVPAFAQNYMPVDVSGWRHSDDLYRLGSFGQQAGIPYTPNYGYPSYPGYNPGYAPAPVTPVTQQRQPDVWHYHEHHHQMEKTYRPTYTVPSTSVPVYRPTTYYVPTNTQYYCYPRTYYYTPSCLSNLFGF